MFSRTGGTSGGYHEYIGGCSVHRGVYHEYIGDIMSTSGDIMMHVGYHEYIGGYHDACGGIP